MTVTRHEISVYGWRQFAACRAVDPEVMACERDTSPYNAKDAKSVCSACPVKDDCLAHAIEHKEQWGIWGGLVPAERNRIINTGIEPRDCGACGLRRLALECPWCKKPRNLTVKYFDKISRERLVELVESGLSDPECAVVIGEEIGDQTIGRDAVYRARRRWGIPSRVRGRERRDATA